MDDSTSDCQLNQSEVNFEFESNKVSEPLYDIDEQFCSPHTSKRFSHTSLYKSSPPFIVLNSIKCLRCGSIQKKKCSIRENIFLYKNMICTLKSATNVFVYKYMCGLIYFQCIFVFQYVFYTGG
ncbi:hypothetical protein Ahy_B05g079248 isoform A [Arachis hypogaea]|uniref:Uncharacterized protein n=1 Tax=Arachis hypogaea TaxID=3818 RepID=A0A444Z9B8_ARAHY|nr:hypothetical protein Ahy_B05g079248 isoform A [Arachis hypogaea]